MNTAYSNGALHGGLRDLLRKQADSVPLPLPLRRFAENWAVRDASAAMQMATERLLASVRPRGSSAPISIESICRLCNITLAGSGRVTSSLDHAWVGYFRGSSHAGEIVFRHDSAIIRVPTHLDFSAARISIAHELGHFLIHGQGTDRVTTRLPSSADEEALAEYAARLLLMPLDDVKATKFDNLSSAALVVSRRMRTTLHSAVSRLGDPDTGLANIRGAILWRISEETPSHSPIEQRLSPSWHLCSPAYVPVRRCRARQDSIVARVAAAVGDAVDSAIEDVRIGTFVGVFRVDVVAWGSVPEGTRIVLSTFCDVDRSECHEPAKGVLALRKSRQLALV